MPNSVLYTASSTNESLWLVACLQKSHLVKHAAAHAGMVGYRFNTVGVSDAISMGTDGMSYSLQSRDLIADSVETVMGAQVQVHNRCLFTLLEHVKSLLPVKVI